MSMFRKPTKKIQRRVFGCDDDEDEDGDPEPPPPPVISKKKENRSAKKNPLLSFVDEEEEAEEFKVKKSTHSKRWTRRKEKDKHKNDADSKFVVNNSNEEPPQTTETETEEGAPKKVSLEGLILCGREALAADGAGDISDGDGEALSEEEAGGFPRFRPESVRAAIVPGHIPDAALIHAARKTRQKARELGGGDFIPIRSESSKSAGSRLVPDDGSGDEEDEGRLHVRGIDLPSDKPRHNVEAASDAEVDSEVEQWEEQQMQKAVPAITDIGMEMGVDLNPFAVAPPPPRLEDAPAHLRLLHATDQPPPATVEELVHALSNRLRELESIRCELEGKREEVGDRLLAATREMETRTSRAAPLDAVYRRAQAIRGYLTDLVECLDEKMPELEGLESRALQLHRRRCEFLQERRRADVRDQAQDVLALAARVGSIRAPDSEEKVRRTAEREGRRRARRLRREATHAHTHREGDSSDDDLPPPQLQQHRAERDAIQSCAASLFADALPAWRSVRGVCARLSRWRRAHPALYHDAYVAECLPRLLAPYVRQQMILWNPLADEDNEDYEKMDWYKCLMMYGVRAERLSSDSEDSEVNGEEEDVAEGGCTEDDAREDPDLLLVPTLIHKVILPKLTELVEVAWDPMCVRACVRLRGVFLRASLVPPRASPQLRALAAAARQRLHAALAADVFLPALPPPICLGPGGSFWRRCLGAGVRLLRAVLALCSPPPPLAADELALALIGTLCTAAGAAPAPLAASAAAALAQTLPRGPAPLRARALRRLAALATRALSALHSDNPLHLKALEQARSVLAEARDAESQLNED